MQLGRLVRLVRLVLLCFWSMELMSTVRTRMEQEQEQEQETALMLASRNGFPGTAALLTNKEINMARISDNGKTLMTLIYTLINMGLFISFYLYMLIVY